MTATCTYRIWLGRYQPLSKLALAAASYRKSQRRATQAGSAISTENAQRWSLILIQAMKSALISNGSATLASTSSYLMERS